MATLAELLADKAKPDETKIVIEGVETTLGELRGGYLRQQDYSRKTAQVKEQTRQLEQERAEFEIARVDAEQKLADYLTKALAGNGAAPTKDDVEDILERDPVAQRLQKQVEEIRAEQAELKKTAQEIRNATDGLKRARFEDQHRVQLERLKANDPDLDVEELIEYAKANYTPRLDIAYKAMVFDKKIEESKKSAREEGMKAGLEQGKKDAVQPMIPQRRVLSPLPDAPKTFDEAVDRAAVDPEILANLFGE